MAFVVEMVRGEPYTPSYAFFSVHANTWKALLALGETFGWMPMGAVPDPRYRDWRPDAYAAAFNKSYHPEEWQFAKRVADDDARALGAALRRAAAALRDENVRLLERPGPFLLRDGMTAEELRAANALPSQAVEEFAEFASGGGFVFAWDD